MIAEVQHSTISGSSSSPSRAFSSNNTAGNLLVVIVVAGSGADTTAVNDTLGNTWTHAATAFNTGSGMRTELWYAENCLGGANTVTATLSASEGWVITIAEYSGLLTSGSLDQVNNSPTTASGATLNSGNITTTQNDELIVGGGCIRDVVSGTVTTAAGFTELSNLSTNRDANASHKIVSSTGTYAWTADSTQSDSYAAVVASFKASGAPPPSLVPGRRYIGWMPAAL